MKFAEKVNRKLLRMNGLYVNILNIGNCIMVTFQKNKLLTGFNILTVPKEVI